MKAILVLRGTACFCFVVAVVAFLVGGRAITELAGTDRVLAEIEGVVFAVVCAVLGVLAEIVRRHFIQKKNEPSNRPD